MPRNLNVKTSSTHKWRFQRFPHVGYSEIYTHEKRCKPCSQKILTKNVYILNKNKESTMCQTNPQIKQNIKKNQTQFVFCMPVYNCSYSLSFSKGWLNKTLPISEILFSQFPSLKIIKTWKFVSLGYVGQEFPSLGDFWAEKLRNQNFP